MQTLWKNVTWFNEKLVGSNAMMLVIILSFLGLGAWYQFAQPKTEQAAGIISRTTSESLKERSLISTEAEDDYLSHCLASNEAYTNGDKTRAARICGCMYEQTADIALKENIPFTKILSGFRDGTRTDTAQGCLSES